MIDEWDQQWFIRVVAMSRDRWITSLVVGK